MNSKSQGKIDVAAIEFMEAGTGGNGLSIDLLSEILPAVIAEVVPQVNAEGFDPYEQQGVNALYEARQKYLARKAVIEAGGIPGGLSDEPFKDSFDEEFSYAHRDFVPADVANKPRYARADVLEAQGEFEELNLLVRRLGAENQSLRDKLSEVQGQLDTIAKSIRV